MFFSLLLLVVAGVLEEPFVAEAYAPELVGATREILIGKKSGAKSIEAKLIAKGIHLNDDQIRDLLAGVKQKALVVKRSLTDDEFMQLVNKYL